MNQFPQEARLNVTFFKNVKTEIGEVCDLDFAELTSVHHAFPNHKLYSPVTYSGNHRTNENTKIVHALVLDFDGKKFDPAHVKNGKHLRGAPPTIGDVLDRFPYACMWHPTKSDSEEYPSFRLIFPLEASLSREGYHDLTQAVLGREQSLTEVTSLDESGFPSAHMWFVPEAGKEWQAVDGPVLKEADWRTWPAPQLKLPDAVASNGSFDPVASSFRSSVCNLNRAAAYVGAMPPAISGSDGHTATFNAARKCRDLGLTEQEIFETLRDCYNPRCEPRWSDHELRHKSREAFKADLRPVADKRSPLPPDRPTAGSTTPPAAESNLSDTASQASGDNSNPDNGSGPDGPNWQPPLGLTESGSLPILPMNAFPPVFLDWVMGVATATQTPPDLAAMLGLATLTTVIPMGTEVQVKPGWVEPLCLWTVVTLPSGERKSAVGGAARAPIDEIEKPIVELAVAQQRAAKAEKKVLQAIATKLTNKLGVKNVSPDIKDDVRDALMDVEAIEIPSVPRFWTSDTTSEGAVRMMHENGGKGAVLSEEGGIFQLMAGLYSKVVNLDPFLKGHAGDPIRVDRKGADPLTIDRAVLTMALAVQPGIIQGLAANQSFRDTGLIARFLYSVPMSKVGKRAISPPPLSDLARLGYRDMFHKLKNRPSGIIEFEPEAVLALDAFRKLLEPRLGQHGDLHQIADWGNKLPGAIARISAVFALTEGDSVISVSSVLRSLNLVNYLISHALAAFSLMGTDADQARAQTLLNWIVRMGKDQFSKRDAHKGNQATFKKSDDLAKPLKLLEESGHVRLVIPEPGGIGRPSSPMYLVNPYTLRQNGQKGQKSEDASEQDGRSPYFK